MSALLTVWALAAALFSLVAVARLRHPVAPAGRRPRPPVLLLRPLDVPTPLEEENLAAPVAYGGPLTQVVLSPFRPRLDAPQVRWLPSDPLTPNRKVGHLLYALAALPRPADAVVLCVDSDVRVDGALVESLVEALAAGAAVASAAPRPEVGASWGAKAMRGLLTQSHHAFQVLDVMSAGAKTICGKAMALSPAALVLLGGLGDHIGEDLELATLLHRQRLPVRLAPSPAVVPQAPDVRLGVVLDRFTRWMQVLRSHRPLLFFPVPALFAPTPVLLVLAPALGDGAAVLATLGLVASRLALAARLDGARALRLEWLLGEATLLVAWGLALWRGPRVTWRGRRYRLEAGGRMKPGSLAATEGAPT